MAILLGTKCFCNKLYDEEKKPNQWALFCENFYKNAPKTLGELQEQIDLGNTKIIDKIQYYSRRITGSSAY